MKLNGKNSFLNAKAALLGGTILTSIFAAGGAVAQEDGVVETEDRIIVTGSRIARGMLDSPAPVNTLNAENILTSGETDISALLQETPALNSSFSTDDSVNTAGTPNGTAQLDLRNLGTNRTLVLVNGRRHVAGISGTAAVDIATIPVALIERVDVLTGGASSIYGADAVTGVVNFILRDDFEGLDYRFQGGISDEGDAEEFFGAITVGGNFADDRGNAVVSVEYTHNEPLFGFDRSFATNEGLFTQVQTNDELIAQLGLPAGTKNTYVGNVRFPFSSRAGAVDIFADDGGGTFFVEEDGSVRPFDFGQPTGSPFESIGGDGIELLASEELILPEFDRLNINGNVRFEFDPALNFFAETKFVYSDTFDSIQVNGFNDFIPILADNAFIPPELATIAAGFTNPAIFVTRDVLDANARPTESTDRYTGRIVVGFDGEFSNGWSYELSYNYGRTEANSTLGRSRIEDRYFAAIDGVALTQTNVDALTMGAFTATALRNGEAVLIDETNVQVGDVLCRTELQAELGVTVDDPPEPSFPATDTTPKTFTPGDDRCVPTSIFGNNSINADAAAFAFLDLLQNSELTQQVVSAVLTGDSADYFELPAGPVGFAFGFEYREETSEFVPPEFEQGGFTFGGIDEARSPVEGEFDVYEFFGETEVPVLEGLPLMEELTVNGSFRYADYSTVGSTLTWAVGGNWQVTEDLRFRGTFNRAIRAPNIDELFSPRQPDFTIGANEDPCDPANINSGSEFRSANCAALVGPNFQSTLTARVVSSVGGNPDLEEERATTITAGVVLTPRWIDGLTITADFYDIQIDDAIDVLAPIDVVENCVDAMDINNSFCAQVDRDPTTGNIVTVRSGQQNIAALETRGVDIRGTYLFDFADVGAPDAGTLNLGVTANRSLRLNDFPFQEFPDQIDPELGEFGAPKWIVNLDATWNWNALNVTWQTRYQSSQLLLGIEFEQLQSDPLFAFPNQTGNAFVHDLQASYDIDAFGGSHRIYAGVNNIGDRRPFLASLTRPVGVVGRFFFVGVNGQF